MLDFAKQLDWLVTMASMPGAKAYAWQRAKDLDWLFPGIAAALKETMIGRVKGSAYEVQNKMKPL